MLNKTIQKNCSNLEETKNFLEIHLKQNPSPLKASIGPMGGRKFSVWLQGKQHSFILNDLLNHIHHLVKRELLQSSTATHPTTKKKWKDLEVIVQDMRQIHAKGNQLLKQQNFFIRFLTKLRQIFGKKFDERALNALENSIISSKHPASPISNSLTSPSSNKKEALAYLQNLAALKDDHCRLISVGQDIDRMNKFEAVVKTCPFDASQESRQHLDIFVNLLKTFASEVPALLDELKKNLNKLNLEIPIPLWRKRNRVDADVVTVQRESSYKSDGTLVPADTHPVECVVFKGLDEKFFGIKIIDSQEASIDTIVLVVKKDGHEKEVCVSGEELTARLHLDPLEVSINSDGRLNSYIDEQQSPIVLKNYLRLLKKQQKNSLISGYPPATLLKIIRAAYLDRQSPFYSNHLGVNLNRSSKLEDKASLNGRKIVAGFRGDKIYLRDLTNKILLAEGGVAKVYIVKDVTSTKTKVVKMIASSGFGAKTPEEALIVAHLHDGYRDEKGQNRLVPGIQKPFHGVVDLGGMEMGILDNHYEGDLPMALGIKDNHYSPQESLFKTLDEKLQAFYDVLLGFHYCVKVKGLIHGDIKPKNILFSRDKTTGNIHLYLADFGSAVLYSPDKIELPSGYNNAWTPNYVPLQEKEERERLGKELRSAHSISENDWKSYVENGQKWDVFSLGCVLCELIAPRVAYLDYTGNYPLPGTFKRESFIQAGVPPRVCDLIGKMLASPERRPDIEEILSAFQGILEDHSLIN